MDQSTGKEDATSLFKVGIWSQLGSRYTDNCAEDEHLNGNFSILQEAGNNVLIQYHTSHMIGTQ